MEAVGKYKVIQLQKRLERIYPDAVIETFNEWIIPENASDLVQRADLVFYTIDFLSLESIVALHDACHEHGRECISAVSAGWGAMALYFSADGTCSFRSLFGLPEYGAVDEYSYVNQFSGLIEKLGPHLGEDVCNAMGKALTCMEDGRPCPAPHLSIGSFCVAALGTTISCRIIAGEPVTPAPSMILLNLKDMSCNENVAVNVANQETLQEI